MDENDCCDLKKFNESRHKYQKLCNKQRNSGIKYSNNVGFACPNKCGRIYHLKNSLYKHMKFDCGVEKQFKCYVCHKQFSRKTSMRNHLFLVHKIIGK